MYLNENKIIFKSEAEIYEHVKSKILDALKYVKEHEHDDCHIKSDANCCEGAWEESVKVSVDKFGLENTISKHFSAFLKQRELDPNVDTEGSGNVLPLPEINELQCKTVKVNFI